MPVLRKYKYWIGGAICLSVLSRAEKALEKLGDGTAHGTSLGFLCCHLGCSEIKHAASWTEKAIEQREPLLPFVLLLPFAKDLRRSSHWPALVKMMTLPLGAM